MVFKDAEEAIEANIDAGRLDHARFEGFNLDSAGFDFGGNIAVAEQHRGDLTRWVRLCCVSYSPVAFLAYGPLHSESPRY
jgi:hypothetical protein